MSLLIKPEFNYWKEPENIRHGFNKQAMITCSPKYMTITSYDVWRQMYFSVTGHQAHHNPDASPEWIGANLRQALQTSLYLNTTDELYNTDYLLLYKEKSQNRAKLWNQHLIEFYKMKDLKELNKKNDFISVGWHYLREDFITIAATNRYTGGYTAWDSTKDQGKEAQVSLYLSDAELGLAVRELLSRCEGPGCKQKKRGPFFFPAIA